MKLEDIITTENFLYANKNARKGKREKYGCFKFNQSLGEWVYRLKKSILDGTYKPSEYSKFEIYCTAGQKTRQITAPTYSDGVVQHVFYEALYPLFDKGFIFDSYGCRKGKGTHKAANRTQQFIRQCDDHEYYLQLDIKKYYYTIDHSILKESLKRKIKDNRIIDYLMMFVDNTSKIGLNVGCLLSQLYGLIYLDRFDHFCKRKLKLKRYIRYVDDILIIGLSLDEAKRIKKECEDFLKRELKLSLSKWKIRKISQGINFCGVRTWKHRRCLRVRSIHNFNKALRKHKWKSISSILAHSKNTATYGYFVDKIKQQITPIDYGLIDSNISKAIKLNLHEFKYYKTIENNKNIIDYKNNLNCKLKVYFNN